MSNNIMIVGVGGQGTLLASRILGNAALAQGYDVKVSEVHGMSQRGGSVVTYVKYGETAVSSPVICRGEADVIIAFEQLEALRWLPYLRRGGKIFVSTERINPMPVITGAAAYPENIPDILRKAGADITVVDAVSLAVAAGTNKAQNVVMIGAYASQSAAAKDIYIAALKQSVPAKILDVNLKAFELGYEGAQTHV
ncbi:indolepyruvate oxidoreductase [Clostridia bacterium]|nr:indolepyruvate oxidoreductase [Clostridia bacterium]